MSNISWYRHCSVRLQLVTLALFLLLGSASLGSAHIDEEFEDDVTTTISSIASPMRRTYTNEWAVRIAGGKVEEANRLANKYGYTNLGPVSFIFEYFKKISIILILNRGKILILSKIGSRLQSYSNRPTDFQNSYCYKFLTN